MEKRPARPMVSESRRRTPGFRCHGVGKPTVPSGSRRAIGRAIRPGSLPWSLAAIDPRTAEPPQGIGLVYWRDVSRYS